jgi:cytochrome c
MKTRLLALAALTTVAGAAPATTRVAEPQNGATAHEVVTKVREAVQYLNDKGLAGFSDFNNNKDARWVWKDSYVFVFSCRDNVMIGHPLRPDLVGKPILQMKDDKDKALFKELCRVAEGRDGGWVEYFWPKPGEGKASRKVSYVHTAQVSFKPDIQVAAGMYDESMSVDALNKLAVQLQQPRKDVP